VYNSVFLKFSVVHASVIMVKKAFTGTSYNCIHVQRFPLMVNTNWIQQKNMYPLYNYSSH